MQHSIEDEIENLSSIYMKTNFIEDKDNFLKRKEKILEKILLHESIDIKQLKKLSRVFGGFVNNDLRRQIWPLLLGIDRQDKVNESNHNTSYLDIIEGLKDDNQIGWDVERSLWAIDVTTLWEEEHRLERRIALSNLIKASLSKDKELFYYQGFHDVVSVFMLVYENDQLVFECLNNLCSTFLRDFMKSNFENLPKLLRLLWPLIYYQDAELHDFMISSGIEPFFILSWIITWYSHDIKTLVDISRLFDILLCSHPAYSLYLAVTIIIKYRNEIMSCECEFSIVHSFISKLLENYFVSIDELIPIADKLILEYPPSLVIYTSEPILISLYQQEKLTMFPKSKQFSLLSKVPSNWIIVKDVFAYPLSNGKSLLRLHKILSKNIRRHNKVHPESISSQKKRTNTSFTSTITMIFCGILLFGAGSLCHQYIQDHLLY